MNFPKVVSIILGDMDGNLSKFICSVLSKHGVASGYTTEHVYFENHYVKGTITLNKPFTVKWSVKEGFEILDNPAPKGSSSFSTVSELLNFFGLRLARKV